MTRKLDGIEDTLYLPLVARIYVSKRFPEYFYDEKALSLEKQFSYDSIVNKSSEYFLMAGACRFHELDKIVKEFIRKNKECNIINIGCGFETSYYRIKPAEETCFYEIDLPGVIESRELVLGKEPNEILIGKDMFDLSWVKQINKNIPTLLTAIGVFQYFNEEKIIGFIDNLNDRFDNIEIIFDAMNYSALKYANRYVKKTGNKNALMYFGVNDPLEFSGRINMDLVETTSFFTSARKQLKKHLKIYTRIAMKVVDEGSRKAYLIHYRKRH